ncbi:MAG: heme exporter protein CcmB [Bacillota bacterium]
MTYLSHIWLLVKKDLISELRSKEIISSMLIFSVLIVVIFSFAFEPDKETIQKVFPGIIWVSFIFAGTLGLNRSFISEQDNDAIMGLMLGIIEPGVIYLAKSITNFVFLLVIQLMTLPLMFVLFDTSVKGSYLHLVLVIILGSWGFIFLGTFMSTFSVNTKFSEILLPIILFPIIVPLLIAAVQATEIVTNQGSIGEFIVWLKVLVAFDVIFTVIPWLLFDYLLEV